MERRPGRVLVISGPSGVGKGTVVRALRERRPDLVVSVSATTRPPREDEVDGVHYRFVSAEEFEHLARSGGLLEWAEFGGSRYGTPAAPVADALAGGHTVVLEIDVQGARQVRERLPDAVLVFLVPPDLQTLAERLRRRGTEDEATIGRRLDSARAELAEADLFDHRVTNDDIATAADTIARILADTAPD